MDTSEFTIEDNRLIEESYACLAESARKRCGSVKEMAVVKKAFDFAMAAHSGVRRRSGEPYILHPIAVARIVVDDIGLGYKSISAALLHDVVEDTEYTIEDIRTHFGDKIASLVDGLTKIKNVLDQDSAMEDKESLQVRNLKRILLTLNDDVRVVLIKLADRLHNCRTIDSMPEYKRDKILSETMFVFIPLAHRLGLYGIKSEMEDIWLRNKEPETYADITRRITSCTATRQREIDDFVVPICDAITAEGFTYKILKRVKTPYSIWNKMKNKGVDFEEIYDLYAVRIVFDPLPGSTVAEERNQCFQIYSIITSIYSGKEDRFRDWVAHPKSNGYEALHCTLMSNSGIWVEVQIRSRRMDDIAEKGIAAHWSYKRNGIGEGSEMDRWLEKVREVLDNSANVNAMELLEIIHNDLTQTEIIVFTPKGDQVRIAKDATVLDFAFQIHSEIGLSAVAGKVNMKLVPLSTPLSSGDQVEIITAQNQTPNIEWLDFLKTRKARGTVNEWLHEHREDEKPQEKDSVRKESPTVLGNFIHLFGKKKSAPESSPGESYQIADCCKPIPGDFILGFKQSDGSVIVHKKSCPQAGRLATGNGKSLVSVSWKDLTCGESFLVRICIKGVDRMGMLNEISRYISLVMSISMKRLNFIADNGVFEGEIDLFVGDTSDLDKLIRKLSKIEGVKTVSRIEL